MAKHRTRRHSTALVRRSAPVVVIPSSRGRVRRAAHAVRHVARRAAPHAKKALPLIGVGVGALVVGYAQGKGFLDRLPQIGGSRVITLGVAGYVATRFFKHAAIRQAGLAALAAAAFDFGRVQAGQVSGFESMGPISGDGGGGGQSGMGY